MVSTLKKGMEGNEVRQLQKLLNQRGYPVDIDSSFGNQTYKAVRAFQSQNLDQHGQPLVVDGSVGPLSWWSLNNPKPFIIPLVAVDYSTMLPLQLGSSVIGRAALSAAIGELKAGAGEIGGDNKGPWVEKYLAPANVVEGNPWCAAFVSWCFLQAGGGVFYKMPFEYTPGARDILKQLEAKEWTRKPGSGYFPFPGDLVVWWRVKADGWQGHVGFVHQYKEGMLYTIEGNKSPKVQGFSYVFSRMEQLLGFGHIPDL
jgi:hypothetical protein